MDYFHRWELRAIAAIIIMLPILLIVELFRCMP